MLSYDPLFAASNPSLNIRASFAAQRLKILRDAALPVQLSLTQTGFTGVSQPFN